MKFLARHLLLMSLAAPLASGQVADPVGEFENHLDVGSPKIAGSATWDATAQTYTFTAGGTNMWGTRDEFHFAFRKIKGDFIVRARVEFAGAGVDPHRKLGWIARANLDPDSPYVDGTEHGDRKLTSLQFRKTKGAITEQIQLKTVHADILQLERRGNTYIFSAAKNGEVFESAELKDFDLGEEPLVGLFLCSHNPEVKEQAVFHDVRVIKPVKVGFTPYRDFIGSRLEVLEVHTGKLASLYTSKEPFEAPNWTPDGKSLLYNISGRAPGWGVLRRFDLATRTPQPFDTGFATRNNNDHVLSFDGKWLGISHQGPETGGRSAVYVLPSTGGTPRLVTPKAPSYFHGWSPDGKWLVYAGGRKEASNPGGPDKYDIYKIHIDGGEETKLGAGPGRSDGPEFSPDGQWIYFNSTRAGGPMQLWRMKPDGTDPEQVSHDELNNWFPHLSPDGKWIVYIAFPKEVAAEDHPYYRHCYLRMMPAAGGPAKVIAYLYGGQGTINVPSWSPDSTRIAFVTNSDSF
ncbi:MAG TPA: biopolymer transporter TolR [Opitutaceae bacterium]|nr:biopolymer transporter TolR [Opitutaceae bacterium]